MTRLVPSFITMVKQPDLSRCKWPFSSLLNDWIPHNLPLKNTSAFSEIRLTIFAMLSIFIL